jgi:DNA-binding transcriptional regulator YhcF (GntR family)
MQGDTMLEVFTSISLDRSAEIPLYMQLYRKLKELIENGILIQDMRLPSIRKFANSLGVKTPQ